MCQLLSACSLFIPIPTGGAIPSPDQNQGEDEEMDEPASGLRHMTARGTGAGTTETVVGKYRQAAACNPFAVKKDQGSNGAAEKRPRGIAESLGSLIGSPSPKRLAYQKMGEESANVHFN